MTAWLVVLGVGLGTFAFRAAAFAAVGARRLPEWTQRPLAFVGPAAIGALVGGMLLTEHARPHVASAAELAAVAVAFAVVRRSGDVARGLLAGFAVLWVLSALA